MSRHMTEHVTKRDIVEGILQSKRYFASIGALSVKIVASQYTLEDEHRVDFSADASLSVIDGANTPEARFELITAILPTPFMGAAHKVMLASVRRDYQLFRTTQFLRPVTSEEVESIDFDKIIDSMPLEKELELIAAIALGMMSMSTSSMAVMLNSENHVVSMNLNCCAHQAETGCDFILIADGQRVSTASEIFVRGISAIMDLREKTIEIAKEKYARIQSGIEENDGPSRD